MRFIRFVELDDNGNQILHVTCDALNLAQCVSSVQEYAPSSAAPCTLAHAESNVPDVQQLFRILCGNVLGMLSYCLFARFRSLRGDYPSLVWCAISPVSSSPCGCSCQIEHHRRTNFCFCLAETLEPVVIDFVSRLGSR